MNVKQRKSGSYLSRANHRALITFNLFPSHHGKLLEHIVLNRLQTYLEDHDKLPTTMFGFRPRLSTQDILLQLKEEVMLPATRNSPTAILALDLKGAFDNVKHAAILSQLNALDCGPRMYQYIRDFLTDRRAILKVGDLATDPILLGSRGTPQGAVPFVVQYCAHRSPSLIGFYSGHTSRLVCR